MRPADRRDQERQELRQTILDTARRLFAERGYEQVTMRALAAEIGYSATTIYHHFPDKHALLEGICTDTFAALREAAGEHLATILDPVDRLRGIGRAYCRFALAHPHHYRFMFMTRFEGEDLARMVAKKADERGDPSRDGYALLVQVVAGVDAAGRLHPRFADHHLAAQICWGGLHGILALHLDKGSDPWVPWRPVQERIDAMLDALIDGMVTP
ncbi:MAG: hypothetical protein RLZZ127_911 [Planctomycetota bacterium]|jgi:AcrR family transcriptional regulator